MAELLDEETIKRRRQIVDDMRRLSDLIVSASQRGDFMLDSPNRGSTIAAANGLTERALSMFRAGEEEVAWWAQVEFYAGLAEPLTRVRMKEPLFDDHEVLLFTPPRAEMIRAWAEGESLGPRFRGQDSTAPGNVDSLREEFVVPFSEAPESMRWAPLIDWRKGSS